MFFVCLWSEQVSYGLFLDVDCRIWSSEPALSLVTVIVPLIWGEGVRDVLLFSDDVSDPLISRRNSTAFSCFCPRTSHPTSLYSRTYSQRPKDSQELFTAYFAAASSSIYANLGLGALLIWSNLVNWSRFKLLLGARQFDFKSKHEKDVLLSKSDLFAVTSLSRYVDMSWPLTIPSRSMIY